MKTILETSGVSNMYPADAGEPDTGWINGGNPRILGFTKGKPEPWYHQLEFEQVDFPVADFIYGSAKEDKKRGTHVIKNVEVIDLKTMLKGLDIEIQELHDNTYSMYRDVKRGK